MRFTMISNYNRLPDVFYENKTDSQLIPMLRLSKQWGPPPGSCAELVPLLSDELYLPNVKEEGKVVIDSSCNSLSLW